ncbi:MAG: ACT domain-containing protein [Pseudonocardiaceae bacterium]
MPTGFQGISDGGDATTLGRGGSDASAVVLAAALGVAACNIFTDVLAVFTADPRVVPDTRRLASLRHEEMLEMAEAGAAVLQPSAVELALSHGIDIHLRSSFSAEVGTAVGAMVHDGDEVRFTAPRVADAEVVAALSAIGADVEVLDDLGTVSVVRAGIARKPDTTARALTALAAAGIAPQLVTTTPGRVTVHISAALVHDAVRLLHNALIPPADDVGVTIPSDWSASEFVSNTPAG